MSPCADGESDGSDGGAADGAGVKVRYRYEHFLEDDDERDCLLHQRKDGDVFDRSKFSKSMTRKASQGSIVSVHSAVSIGKHVPEQSRKVIEARTASKAGAHLAEMLFEMQYVYFCSVLFPLGKPRCCGFCSFCRGERGGELGFALSLTLVPHPHRQARGTD